MKKYNTIIIRDTANFYIADIRTTPKRNIKRINSFNSLKSQQLKDSFKTLKLNQFYIIEVIEYVSGAAVKILKSGELVNDKNIPINFYEMNSDEIIKFLNKKNLSKYLRVKET